MEDDASASSDVHGPLAFRSSGVPDGGPVWISSPLPTLSPTLSAMVAGLRGSSSDTGAMNNLGLLYQQGWGVRKDLVEAVRLLEKGRRLLVRYRFCRNWRPGTKFVLHTRH